MAAGRRRATGHPHRRQMIDALEPMQIAEQQLAAPNRCVAAVAGAVVDRSERGLDDAVLGKTGGQMGVMVLDPDELDALALERVFRRQIFRVKVVDDDFRTNREEPFEVHDSLAERAERLVVLEVADVMADPRAIALGDAERALQLGAAGQ